MEHAARPPARFSSLPNQEIVNTNKSHEVTPFWHNDTHPRVTVTFGARRLKPEGIAELNEAGRKLARVLAEEVAVSLDAAGQPAEGASYA